MTTPRPGISSRRSSRWIARPAEFSERLELFPELRSYTELRWTRVHYIVDEDREQDPGRRCLNRLVQGVELDGVIVSDAGEAPIHVFAHRNPGVWKWKGLEIDGRRLLRLHTPSVVVPDRPPSSPEPALEPAPAPTPTPTPTSKPPPEPLAPLTESPLVATIDGRAVEIAGAVALRHGELGTYVVLSDQPIDCAAAQTGWVAAAKGQRLIHLTLAELWTGQADRSRVSVTRASWTGGIGDAEADAAALDPGFGDADSTARLRIDYEGEFEIEGSTMTLRGAREVVGCGDQPLAGPARPQPGLSVEIAGHEVTILGARVLEPSPGERHLALSSGPLTCETHQHRYDAEVFVRFVDGEAKEVQLRGARTLTDLGVGRPDLAIELGAPRPETSSVTGHAELELDLPTGVHLKLEGSFDAQMCLGDER